MDIFGELEETKGNAKALPATLSAALGAMPYVDPFFSAFISGLKLTACDWAPVMATNCVNEIFYNPKTLNEQSDKWTAETLIGVLAHECMHILRLDGELMRTDINHDLMNIAMDGIINRDLKASGYMFPTLRMSDPVRAMKDPAFDYGEGFACDDTSESTMPLYNELLRLSKKNSQQLQASATGSDVALKEYRKARKAAGGARGVREQVQDAAQVASAIAQDMAEQLGVPESKRTKQANGMDEKPDADEPKSGTGGGWGLESSASARALENLGIRIKRPKIKLLRTAGAQVRGMLRSNIKRQRSMLATNPLSAAWGRLLPGRRRALDYRIAIAIDASGSITNQQLAMFTAAAHQWAQMFVGRGREIQVCYWARRVCASGPMSRFVDESQIPNAGGGTDFSSVLGWLTTLPDTPTHLVCFTDLQFHYPEGLPGGTQTIWVVPPADMGREPGFGTKVELDA